jgi:Ca-activated chloride channel homolog
MRNAPFVLTLLLGCALILPAWAESFNRRLARGQALLKSGDIQEAATVFRDLQVEDPDSNILRYNVGYARYQAALEDARAHAVPEALQTLEQAAVAFEEASMTTDKTLRKNAQFNKATTFAQVAKQMTAAADPQHTIAAFERAITTFDDYLRQYPGDPAAEMNLNNVRYELKKFLQQAPPAQEQQEGGEGNDTQDQDQQQPREGQEPGPPQDEGDDQQQQQQQDQAGDDQEQDQQGEGEEQEDGQQDMAQARPQESDSDATPPIEENQNIEAILKSLEDMDEQQQKEMRQHPRRLTFRSKWW